MSQGVWHRFSECNDVFLRVCVNVYVMVVANSKHPGSDVLKQNMEPSVGKLSQLYKA